MSESAKEFLERMRSGHPTPGTPCAGDCGREITEATGEHNTGAGLMCDDCYYSNLASCPEMYPILTQRIRRG